MTAPWTLEPFAVLDGGLASELAVRGHDLADPLWSAKVLLEDPAAVAAVHRDYLEAGADVITTASYQASLPGLAARGLSQARALELLRDAVGIARRCCVAVGGTRPRVVVASAGSYGAARADGSEYTGHFDDVDDAALVAFHRERLPGFVDADAIAFETIASARECAAIARALADHRGPPAWLSLVCRDGAHSGSGDTLRACARATADCHAIAALGINCTAPAVATAALAQLAAVDPRPLVVYPNAGQPYDAAHRCFVGAPATPSAFARDAEVWLRTGARVVGGCCETTPAHVRALAALRDAATPHRP
ncbi:MAG: homocysteine S-methyltransferase [Deltaproteobacteria bacterium]|nr:homocysteine S-methyltransferase [Deltaproteobacteria bacterium]